MGWDYYVNFYTKGSLTALDKLEFLMEQLIHKPFSGELRSVQIVDLNLMYDKQLLKEVMFDQYAPKDFIQIVKSICSRYNSTTISYDVTCDVPRLHSIRDRREKNKPIIKNTSDMYWLSTYFRILHPEQSIFRHPSGFYYNAYAGRPYNGKPFNEIAYQNTSYLMQEIANLNHPQLHYADAQLDKDEPDEKKEHLLLMLPGHILEGNPYKSKDDIVDIIKMLDDPYIRTSHTSDGGLIIYSKSADFVMNRFYEAIDVKKLLKLT